MSNPTIDTETTVTVYKYSDIPSTPIIENCTTTKTNDKRKCRYHRKDTSQYLFAIFSQS